MNVLRHPAVIRVAGLLIGALFVVAAVAKLADLPTFARQIRNFHLAPVAITNLLAMVIPWIELLAGACLVVRLGVRSGAWVVFGSLVVFTVAVAIALARHLNIECGCFGALGATRVGVGKLAENAGMLLLAAIAALEPRPPGAPAAAAGPVTEEVAPPR